MAEEKPYEAPQIPGCGIPMDLQMKAMYDSLYHLNVDECVPILGNKEKLEIKLAGKKLAFPEFVKTRTKTACFDHFSTKELNDEAIKHSGMPPKAVEACKKFYIEVGRAWGVIEDEGNTVGIAYRFDGYNGIPRLIPDLEEFINQPDFNEKYGELFGKLAKEDMTAPVAIYRIGRFALHKDFLTKNPLAEMGQLKHFFRTLPGFFSGKKSGGSGK